MKEKGNEPHVVLYSCSQGFFHIEEASVTAEKTLSNLCRGVRQDYVLLALCESYEKAYEKSNELERVRAESPLWPAADPIEEE